MDLERFDAVVRTFALLPRRAALAAALGISFATLTRWSGDPAGARRRKKKRQKKCKGDTRKCGKQCIPLTECCGGCGEQRCCDGVCADCCDDGDCPAAGACISGGCVCPIGTTDCGDVCADLASDGDNCGACGNACASGGCIHGACNCSTANDCPDGCGCLPREDGGGSGCAGAPPAPAACTSDDDCDLGTFCIDSGLANFCSGVCLG